MVEGAKVLLSFSGTLFIEASAFLFAASEPVIVLSFLKNGEPKNVFSFWMGCGFDKRSCVLRNWGFIDILLYKGGYEFEDVPSLLGRLGYVDTSSLPLDCFCSFSC